MFLRDGIIRARHLWSPLQHKSSFIFRFRRTDISHETVARRPLFRTARFTRPRCSFFWPKSINFAWRAWHFRDIWGSKTSFCMTGSGHPTRQPRGRPGTLWALLKHWQAGRTERCCWKSFFVAAYSELSSDLIWDMIMIPCGKRKTSDASGSFFVAGAVLCRPRPRSGWDLGKTSFELFNVYFSCCAQCFAEIWHDAFTTWVALVLLACSHWWFRVLSTGRILHNFNIYHLSVSCFLVGEKHDSSG